MESIPHILFIGHLWPEPDSSAGGYRTMALINSCMESGWKVSFASVAQTTQWSEKLQQNGIDCYSISLNDQSFDKWISQLKADFCVFDRFMSEEKFSWRIARHSPDCIQVLDTCDLHFLRRSRQNELKKQTNKSQINKDLDYNSLYGEDAIREISSIYRCDLSLIISSYEMQLLNNEFNINSDLLFYLPFMFDIHKTRPDKDFSQRKNFFMIGNFLHDPNWDAVRWCKQSLWPKIRSKLPKAELHVYGAYTPEKANQLHNEAQGFYIMGRAGKLPELIRQYRVNLVPLRFGAGIKGKIADGFRYGLPCITTPVGAEGMADDLPWGGYICDNEQSFVESAVKLYSDADVWQQKQRKGYEIIEKVHNKKIHQPRFIQQLYKLKENIGEQRKKNFTASMLKYHKHRSHEFMSRWIEEKNK